MQISDCYYLGKITKKHGVKGSLIVFLDTDEPEQYSNLESVFVEQNKTLIPFFFEEVQPYGRQKLLVKIEGVPPNEVDSLINKSLYLPLNTLPKLRGKQFYYHEIIGFKIVSQKQEIGVIKEVVDQSAQAIFKLDFYGKEILIPIVEDWLQEVNHTTKTIIMNLPEGLVDVNL